MRKCAKDGMGCSWTQIHRCILPDGGLRGDFYGQYNEHPIVCSALWSKGQDNPKSNGTQEELKEKKPEEILDSPSGCSRHEKCKTFRDLHADGANGQDHEDKGAVAHLYRPDESKRDRAQLNVDGDHQHPMKDTALAASHDGTDKLVGEAGRSTADRELHYDAVGCHSNDNLTSHPPEIPWPVPATVKADAEGKDEYADDVQTPFEAEPEHDAKDDKAKLVRLGNSFVVHLLPSSVFPFIPDMSEHPQEKGHGEVCAYSHEDWLKVSPSERYSPVELHDRDAQVNREGQHYKQGSEDSGLLYLFACFFEGKKHLNSLRAIKAYIAAVPFAIAGPLSRFFDVDACDGRDGVEKSGFGADRTQRLTLCSLVLCQLLGKDNPRAERKIVFPEADVKKMGLSQRFHLVPFLHFPEAFDKAFNFRVTLGQTTCGVKDASVEFLYLRDKIGGKENPTFPTGALRRKPGFFDRIGREFRHSRRRWLEKKPSHTMDASVLPLNKRGKHHAAVAHANFKNVFDGQLSHSVIITQRAEAAA